MGNSRLGVKYENGVGLGWMGWYTALVLQGVVSGVGRAGGHVKD